MAAFNHDVAVSAGGGCKQVSSDAGADKHDRRIICGDMVDRIGLLQQRLDGFVAAWADLVVEQLAGGVLCRCREPVGAVCFGESGAVLGRVWLQAER
ncbi:MAG: hypothetical protein GY926_13155 [bacterium]|nr:hypothetical protein [bacterium]MCP4966168.1 hypothetical protein [bacterium]